MKETTVGDSNYNQVLQVSMLWKLTIYSWRTSPDKRGHIMDICWISYLEHSLVFVLPPCCIVLWINYFNKIIASKLCLSHFRLIPPVITPRKPVYRECWESPLKLEHHTRFKLCKVKKIKKINFKKALVQYVIIILYFDEVKAPC